MNQTTNTTAGIDLDLDKLEALARAADPNGANHLVTHYRNGADLRAEEAWRQAATPATVLQLIELARRSTSGSAPEKCDDCDGRGHDGDFQWQGHFQPPEPGICNSCGGSGKAQASGSDGTAAAGVGDCSHVWNDFGQLGGRNVSWCPRCDVIAWTGKEPSAAATSGSELATCQPAALTGQPAAAVCQPLADERAKFKAWWGKRVPAGDDSDHAGVFAFEVWQAALAQQAGAPVDLVRAGWFIREGLAWVQTSSDDPRATVLYRNTGAEKVAAPAPTAQDEQTQAARDVLAERRRQLEQEGWHPDQDDDYEDGQLSMAAACYTMQGNTPNYGPPPDWPWDREWWKPSDDRRNLVKAGALILADIERIDRAAMSQSKTQEDA